MELQRKLLKNKNFFSLFRAIDRNSNCLGARTSGRLLCVHTCGPGSQTDLERECYGLVVDMVERRVLCSMGREPLCGSAARTRFVELLLENSDISFHLEEALEGELVCFYQNQGQWSIAMRGCLDLRTERPQMYQDIARLAPSPNKLQKEYTYQFVLIGGKYSPVIGGEYKLVLVGARRQKDHARVEVSLNWEKPRRLDSFAELEADNASFKAARTGHEFEAMQVPFRGVCVRAHISEFEEELFFFDSERFRYVKSMQRHIQPSFLRYIEVYRAGNLHTYLALFPEESSLQAGGEMRTVVDLVYIFYQSMALELFNLFKKCVNMVTGELNRTSPAFLGLGPAHRRVVVQIRNRMQRFRRIHYIKFSYRYVLDLLKDPRCNLEALAKEMNQQNKATQRLRTRQTDFQHALELFQVKN